MSLPNTWLDKQPGGYAGQIPGGGGPLSTPGIDSLNGILLKGLLGRGPGSLILGFFNLGWLGISIGISDIPGKPMVYPPLYGTDREEERDKYLTIKIRLKDNDYTKVYRISAGEANVLIKLNESVKNMVTKSNVAVDKFIIKPIKRAFKIIVKDFTNK